MSESISIVLPAYNVEKFIGEAIKSIQEQTCKNWEAIIVNDGSTDNSVRVINKLIEGDSRFRLINQTNGGVAKARNAGISAATGKYLTFLDGDDKWEPTFLSSLLSAIENMDADMAYCGYTHLYTNGIKRKFSYPYSSGHILLDVINGCTQIHIGALLVKRDLIDKISLRFEDTCLIGEDQEFIWKLALIAKVQAVPKELMVYRIRSGSAITTKWDWKKHIHAHYAFKRASEFILSHADVYADKSLLRETINSRIAYKLYKIIWRMIKNGYYNDAHVLLKEQETQQYLSVIDSNKLKFADKYKYKVVASENRWIWGLTKLIRF